MVSMMEIHNVDRDYTFFIHKNIAYKNGMLEISETLEHFGPSGGEGPIRWPLYVCVYVGVITGMRENFL